MSIIGRVFKKSREEVFPGSIYIKKAGIIMPSFAEVVSIEPNKYGVPHVHFRFFLEPGHGNNQTRKNHENRVLALNEFMKCFVKKV